MKIALLSLTLLALVATAVDSCSCFSAPIKTNYYVPSYTRVVRALVTSKRTQPCPKCNVIYKVKVLEAFKGCKAPVEFDVSTPDNSAACGVNLEVGTNYLLYLTADKVPAINLCQAIPKFSDVSASDLKFLRTRNVCCDGKCRCVPGTRAEKCYVRPCNPSVKPPCAFASKCVANYCGGCSAEWFAADGFPTCSQ
jgi:hypothetical protein